MRSFVFLILLTGSVYAQEKMNLLHYLIKSDTTLNFILDNISRYEPQIIYTQVNRNSDNSVKLNSIKFNVDNLQYFYPASTVKLPAAVLALEKINELDVPEFNKYSRMKIDSAYKGQTAVEYDSSSENYFPSIAHYIKKIFLVSDNDAFSRVYEFLGQKYLNEKLHSKGYNHSIITNRLSVPLSPYQNRCTNPIIFYNNKENEIYKQPLTCNDTLYYNPAKNLFKGIGYILEDSLINRPKDFSKSNYLALEDMHKMLIAVIYPEALKPEERFNLTGDDYKFLYKYISMLPRESKYPAYDTSYYDSYVKYFIFGNSREEIPDYIRIFNKVGLAYGYLIDNAYIVDFKNNIEFFLSAVIYVNDDGIFNDDKYEYYETGFPFLHNLGRAIYNYEIIREKEFKSDLSKFKLNYKD